MDTIDEVAPRKRGMTPIRVTLTAGVPARWDIEGDWIACITEPNGVNDLTIRFDQSEKVPLPAGLGFRRYYRTIELESAIGGAFVVLAGFGSVADARATSNVSVTATIAAGNTLDNGGDVTVANGAGSLLLAQDPLRNYASITSPSTNTGTVRIGNVGVGSNTGIPLEPGQTLSIGTTAAIYVRNDSGASQTLSAASVREV